MPVHATLSRLHSLLPLHHMEPLQGRSRCPAGKACPAPGSIVQSRPVYTPRGDTEGDTPGAPPRLGRLGMPKVAMWVPTAMHSTGSSSNMVVTLA